MRLLWKNYHHKFHLECVPEGGAGEQDPKAHMQNRTYQANVD